MSANSTPKPITRIDLEATGGDSRNVRIKQWREGWREGDAPDLDILTTEKSIMFHLMDFEKQGFTCEMASKNLGRALRGKTTRIDLDKLPDGWHYRKFPYGWSAKTKPMSDTVKTEAEVQEILAWCEANGWTVHRINAEKARAWKGAPQPVHDTATILQMRRRAQAEKRDYFVDFAFDG
jgi:hypothetical protein